MFKPISMNLKVFSTFISNPPNLIDPVDSENASKKLFTSSSIRQPLIHNLRLFDQVDRLKTIRHAKSQAEVFVSAIFWIDLSKETIVEIRQSSCLLKPKIHKSDLFSTTLNVMEKIW